MTDGEVVKLVCDGDIDKFALIVERYEAKLTRYIKRLINQPDEEVEDVLAEVFISVYSNIQGFDQKRSFSSWIYRIAHNKAIDYFKLKKNNFSLNVEDEELIGDGKKLFEEIAAEEEQKKLVANAVEKLEVKYREVILLYFFEDKSYEEISDILHKNTNEVGVLLFRAKAILKKKLET